MSRAPAPLWLVTFALLLSSPAHADWFTGSTLTYYQPECSSRTQQIFSESLAGFWGWEDGPKVGDVFWVRSSIAIIGNSCNGGAFVFPEFILPAGVELAVDEEYPVLCWDTDLRTMETRPIAAEDCPQTASRGTYGITFGAGMPVPFGRVYEVWVPVYAKRKMTGGPEDKVTVTLKVISDTTHLSMPSVGLFVEELPPRLEYATPATSAITETSAHLEAVIYSHYFGGESFIDLGKTEAFELPPVRDPISPDFYWASVWHDWEGLESGTTYFWRVRYVSPRGTIVGETQSFTTAGVKRHLVTLVPTEQGTIDSSPAAGALETGTVIELLARAAEGQRFERWLIDGNEGPTSNPLHWTVTAPVTIEARFVAASTGQDPAGGGGRPGGGAQGPIVDEDEPDAVGCSSAPMPTPLLVGLLVWWWWWCRALPSRRSSGRRAV